MESSFLEVGVVQEHRMSLSAATRACTAPGAVWARVETRAPRFGSMVWATVETCWPQAWQPHGAFRSSSGSRHGRIWKRFMEHLLGLRYNGNGSRGRADRAPGRGRGR